MADSAPAAATPNLAERSVSELAADIRQTMETRFDRVRVRGELGRVTVAKSGHLYADLKDANASLSLVMWKANVQRLGFRPEEGLEVVAEGRISTFAGKSQYQLIAERMEPAGAGALLAQLEKLKTRLRAEGLFEPERKKPIPYLPRLIGVVTSPTGAVIRDILHRLEERFPRRVLLWPVQVQGVGAKDQIVRAIEGFNRLGGELRPDVLIVARGGGSVEDLWTFNEEEVVRAAAKSAIPLISAVGHETDTTLIDYAADKRAPTPTAAAEIAVPVRAELLARVADRGARLAAALAGGRELRRNQLLAAAARLPRPDRLLADPRQRLDRAGDRIDAALRRAADAAAARLARVGARLRPEALTLDLARRAERASELHARLGRGLVGGVRRAGERHAAIAGRLRPDAIGLARRVEGLAGLGRLLDTLSHRSALARGFALVTRADGAVVRAAGAVAAGEALTLAFADGAIAATAGGPLGTERAQGPATAPDGRRKPRREGGDGQGDLF